MSKQHDRSVSRCHDSNIFRYNDSNVSSFLKEVQLDIMMGMYIYKYHDNRLACLNLLNLNAIIKVLRYHDNRL